MSELVKKKRGKGWKYHASKWTVAFLRSVLIFGLAFIILKPFIYKILMAFMSVGDLNNNTVNIIPAEWDTYFWQQAWTRLELDKTAFNTIFISLCVGLIQTIVCTMIGYGLARFKFPGASLLFVMVVIILLVPHQVLQIPEYLRFVDFKMVDTPWPIFVLAFCGLGIKEGLYIYLLREFFRSMPNDLEEAAYIDGCGTIRTFFSVMLPNARTMMTTVFLFSFCWQYTDTDYSQLYYNETKVFGNLINTIYIRVGLSAEMTQSYICRNAACLLILIPLIGIFVFAQRGIVKSITLSGMAN